MIGPTTRRTIIQACAEFGEVYHRALRRHRSRHPDRRGFLSDDEIDALIHAVALKALDDGRYHARGFVHGVVNQVDGYLKLDNVSWRVRREVKKQLRQQLRR